MDNKKKNGMRSRYDEDMDWLDDDDDYLDDGGLIGSLLFGDKKKKVMVCYGQTLTRANSPVNFS